MENVVNKNVSRMLLTEDVIIDDGVVMIVTMMTKPFFIVDRQPFCIVKRGLDGRPQPTVTKNY